jgi:beta-glucosidase
MAFRNDFVWGGASASYQVEGAAFEDGKGLSVWDRFCEEPGRIVDGSSGAVACDHYHRYQEDVNLMRRIGYKAYRFSISWPRILPEGDGTVNERGLAFYDRLVDALLAAGITPYATLFHWDYPYALYQRGGWLNGDSPRWFADYAGVVAQRLGDRVKHFWTLNEPQCFMGLSYDQTEHAPGIKLPAWDTLRMWRHVLLGHGCAVEALRANVKDARVGYAPVGGAHYPATETPADIEAARKAYFAVEDRWLQSVAAWCDPPLLGTIPEALPRRFGKDFPAFSDADLKTIHAPLDFLGQNVYNGAPVRAANNDAGYEYAQHETGHPITAAKWPVTPESLYWAPTFLFERYKLPFYVSENGLSCADTVSLDGKVHDPARIDFLSRYLRALRRAADDGVDVRGYFHWCVTDNFEWARGYTERFGMIFCDYPTQKRILKDSAYWYADVIKTNGENLSG